jgi:dermatan 4-sulfotransferase 1
MPDDRMNFFYRLLPLYRNIDERLKTKWIVSHIALSKKNGYCYFRLPKCANSTLIRSLAHYDPRMGYDVNSDPNGNKAKKMLNAKIDALLLTPKAVYENYFSFTFVRDPYARTLSAYLDKIVLDNPRFLSIRKKVEAYGDQSFHSFISFLENGGVYENIHFASQRALLPIKPDHLHFIGRVESLETDLEFVINRIYGEGVYHSAQTSRNAANNSRDLLNQYYDESLRKRVHAIYRRDFEELGYAA